MRRIALPFVVWSAGSLACAGADRGDAPLPSRSARDSVRAEPVAVEVSASRVGAAMRLEIRALGRGADEHAAFEDPGLWRITARQADRTLQRLVNGPLEIKRSPAGRQQWDTIVTFSIVYQVAEAGAVRVSLVAPGGPAIVRVFEP